MSDIRTARNPEERKQASKGVKMPVEDWSKPSGIHYRCKVIIVFPPEENGLISVYAATLPGVASQGRTEKEALENIVEAFEGVIATYKESGQEIPWKEQDPRRKMEQGAQVRWVFVRG